MTKANLLMLEVTSHCNMHCTFCPSDDLVRKKGNVSDEHAKQLIRAAAELAPGVPIMFNVLGEPFLNKKLFDYIGLVSVQQCALKHESAHPDGKGFRQPRKCTVPRTREGLDWPLPR
jgi:MoaA/NifB/PqqE/SkfB family radical SAM enzyme